MVTLPQVVSEILSKGVLTQDDLISINDLLRHSDPAEGMGVLDTLLDALMNREVHSQNHFKVR